MKNHRILGSSLLVAFLALLLALGACQNPIAEAAQAIKAAAASPTASITAPGGADLASGAGLDLGSVGLAATKDISLTITNSGKTALVIDPAATSLSLGAGTEPGAITIVSLPTSIEPGKSGTVVLRLTRQTSAGTKTATLVLKTNDVAHPDITLKVSGLSLDGTAKDITSFGFEDISAPGIISGNDITIFVPDDGTQVAMRIPAFEHTGSKVTVGGQPQASGDASSHQDFTSPVIYRVTSLDGLSYKDYVVTVVRNPKAPILVPHDRTIEASWTAVPNATAYQVWYYAGTDPAKAAKFGPSVASGTTASITGLTNGVSYTVWIRAEYASGIASSLGQASAPATVNIKYFGWLYSGYSSGGKLGVGKYAVSLADGSLTGTDTLVSSDLAPSGSSGIQVMAVDKLHGFLFYAFRSSSSTSSAFLVQSARIDPTTGNLIENPAMTASPSFQSLVVSPDGRHLYGDSGDMYYTGLSRIFCWDISQSDGSLSNQREVADYTQGWFRGIAIHPTLNLLYVAVFSSNPSFFGIRIYDLDGSGNPTYRTSLTTPDYPRSLSLSPDGSRFFVSFSQDSATHPLGLAAYDLVDGLPVSSTPVWTSIMGTATAQWETPVCVNVPGSATACTVFAYEYLGNINIESFSGTGTAKMKETAGSSLSAADSLSLPAGSKRIYASRLSGSIISYDVTSTPGLLGARVDTGKGTGGNVVSTLVLPW